MAREMELYEVSLPEDFDYEGTVPKLSGNLHAKSPRQAVMWFVFGKKGEANKPIYEKFKVHVDNNTEQFVVKVTRAIAKHYADKYSSNPDYDDRLNRILQRIDIERSELIDHSALVDALETYYKTKWGNDSRKLRNIYRAIKKQQAKMTVES